MHAFAHELLLAQLLGVAHLLVPLPGGLGVRIGSED
jgi:hypothetical protein